MEKPEKHEGSSKWRPLILLASKKRRSDEKKGGWRKKGCSLSLAQKKNSRAERCTCFHSFLCKKKGERVSIGRPSLLSWHHQKIPLSVTLLLIYLPEALTDYDGSLSLSLSLFCWRRTKKASHVMHLILAFICLLLSFIFSFAGLKREAATSYYSVVEDVKLSPSLFTSNHESPLLFRKRVERDSSVPSNSSILGSLFFDVCTKST